MARASGRHVGPVEVAHEAQRRAEHVADAERHRAPVVLGQVVVEQVGHDLQLAGREHLFGDLAAGVEAVARQGDAAARPRQLQLELPVVAGQHDEAALGAGDVDGRVEHQRQHLVEHAARAERAQPFEQRRHLADVADRRAGRRRARRLPARIGQEHHLGAAAAAELDPVAVRQPMLGDRPRR